jgi:hypothetical protein
MSLQSSAQRLKDAARKMERISGEGSLQAMLIRLDKTGKLSAILPRVQREVARAIRPVVVAELSKSYRASGVGDSSYEKSSQDPYVSGSLKRAVVTDVTVQVFSNAVVIRMPRGLPTQVYKMAGAFKYGAVRNKVFTAVKNEFNSRAGRQMQARGERGFGLYGQKAKASIKKKVLGGQELSGRQGTAQKAISAGSVVVIKPKPPFYTLNSAAVAKIQSAFNDAMTKALARALGGKAA